MMIRKGAAASYRNPARHNSKLLHSELLYSSYNATMICC